MSSTSYESNVVKLQLAMLAYNFNNWFRRLCLPEKMKLNRMETLRAKLIKISGKSSYPLVDTGHGNCAVHMCIEKNSFKRSKTLIGFPSSVEYAYTSLKQKTYSTTNKG